MDQNEVIQIKSDEDGCVYLCDLATGKWRKVCDIAASDELPESVRRKLDVAWRGMKALAAL
jgi:hypothetical protein